MIALVTGSTGFLGREVVKALLSQDIEAQDVEVRCLVRTHGREEIFGGRQVDIRYGGIGDPATLRAACRDVDALVHLVAIIREKGDDTTFDRVNHMGTRNVVEAAREEGVKRFIHVSAIGARDDPAYPYLYSKWQGEQAVINGGIPYTIIRPSLLFGDGDEFINSLAGLVRAFPIVPVAGSGRNRFQPIAVDEVARCVAESIGREDLADRTVEVGGPEHLSYNDMIDIICRTYRVRRLRLHIPLPVMRMMVRLMEVVLPKPPATTEQLRMVSLPNVTEPDAVENVYGFKPRPLEGNIDFIKRIGFWDGINISIGLMPPNIRDH